MRTYFTYILSNKNRTVFYIGVTNNIKRRISEHKDSKSHGFTKRYNANELLYYDTFTSIVEAIKREKQQKRWHRQWKINLIKESNPEMRDISMEL